MNTRTAQLLKRKTRIRAKLHGTAIRPRLTVIRSNTKLGVQLIDDDSQTTMMTFAGEGKNKVQATALGTKFAEWAKTKKIASIIFDRSGYLYHGSIQALADAIRAGGIQV